MYHYRGISSKQDVVVHPHFLDEACGAVYHIHNNLKKGHQSLPQSMVIVSYDDNTLLHSINTKIFKSARKNSFGFLFTNSSIHILYSFQC
jgi:hypothetical protein